MTDRETLLTDLSHWYYEAMDNDHRLTNRQIASLADDLLMRGWRREPASTERSWWWCPHCGVQVDWFDATFEETHMVCGCLLESRTNETLEDPLVQENLALRAKLDAYRKAVIGVSLVDCILAEFNRIDAE